jgi:hypothetical protein
MNKGGIKKKKTMPHCPLGEENAANRPKRTIIDF